MTTIKQEQQKTELEQGLDTFRGYHQAHHRYDPNILLNEIWEWASALQEAHPFLHADKSHGEDTVILDIRLGNHTEGRFVANLVESGKYPIFRLSLKAPDSRVSVDIRCKLNHDGMFFTPRMKRDEEIHLEQGLLNRDYLDYLLGRLLNYLIEQIEPHKLSSSTT